MASSQRDVKNTSSPSSSPPDNPTRNLSEIAAPPPSAHHHHHHRQPESEPEPEPDPDLPHNYNDGTNYQFLTQQREEPRELATSESTVPPVVTSEEGSQRQHHHFTGNETWEDDGYYRRDDGRDLEGLPRQHQQTQEQLEKPNPPTSATVPLSKRATHLYTVSYLIFFSIWGTLARLGLQSLTFYRGAPVTTGVLWANVGGCVVMGFFLEDRNVFREEWGVDNGNGNKGYNGSDNGDDEHEAKERLKRHKSVKKTIPLYIGLTTGFCGCFTSFSSFIRDVFLALSNDLPLPDPSTSATTISATHRNGGYSFMAIVAIIIIEVSLSLSALIFGAHFALATSRVTPTVPFSFTRKYLDRVFVVLGWGCWLGAVFMAIWPPDRHSHSHTTETWRSRAIFSIVFAPLGCLFRFYISLHLNSRIPSFPLGTFVANILGTIILGMCYDLQHVDGIGAVSGHGQGLSPTPSKSILTSCQILQGIMDGFCGSATTVSTWVSELNGLSCRRSAYFYGIVSVGVGLGFLVVIMGSLRWTLGFVEGVC